MSSDPGGRSLPPPAFRRRGMRRLSVVTAGVGVTSVLATGAIAAALPGSAHTSSGTSTGTPGSGSMSSGSGGSSGAGFPTAVKLAAVARQPGGKVVAGNGAEGEPASHKDKHLLWLEPHLVLDGLQLAAAAVGARRACRYLHRHDQLQRRLAGALAERAAAGWDQIAVELVTAPPRFLSGEEPALASRIGRRQSLHGGLARPAFKRPPVYERGAGRAPTLVQNVETLAHLALIAGPRRPGRDRPGAALPGRRARPGRAARPCPPRRHRLPGPGAAAGTYRLTGGDPPTVNPELDRPE